MKQTLRIFRKDLRHHWPEISISLVLLALYCWREVRTEYMGVRAYEFISFIPWLEFVQLLLPLSWFLLIVRLVQDESLVGDRQWWVTKPYQWPKLLAAKLLSMLIWLLVPLFLAKCFLLRAGGFALAPHLTGLIRNVFGLPLILFVFCFVLACLSRTLGHAVIAVIAVFLLMTGGSTFERFIPDHSLESLERVTFTLSGIIISVTTLAVVLWQYARRRTLHARTLLLAAILATGVVEVVTPYRALMEKKYPSAALQDQPFHMTFRPAAPPDHKPTSSPRWKSDYVALRIPIQISGVSSSGFVTVDAQRLSIEDSSGGKWNDAWARSGQEWWPENNSAWSILSVKNSVYEQLKSQTVKLRLEMAVSEFRLSAPREVLIRRGDFAATSLGICSLPVPRLSMLTCRSAFVVPSFVATFDPTNAKCPLPTEKGEEPLAASRFASFRHGQPGLWIDPVISYTVYFFSGTNGDPLAKAPRQQTFCPGDRVTLTTPYLYRRVRMEAILEPVQMENFRLVYPGEEGGTQWDLRSFWVGALVAK